MHPEMERIQNCLAAVRRHTDFVPEVAVVLGSGLGGFADMVKQTAVVPYSEIPGFPVSTAPGHAGRFVFGYVEETPVVVMQGRVHLYEGYTPHDVVLPVRLMKAMGAKILFVTNASGGIRGDLTAGTLMSITDHISALIPNPLIGANIDELGVRFPDMSNAYDKGLRAILRETAKKDGMRLIAVVLGTPAGQTRFDEARAMLEYGFAGYQMFSAVGEGEALNMSVPVRLGGRDSVSVVSGGDCGLLIKKGGQGDISLEAALVESVHAPVCEGDVLGEIRVKQGGRIVAIVPAVAGETVQLPGIIDALIRIRDHFMLKAT